MSPSETSTETEIVTKQGTAIRKRENYVRRNQVYLDVTADEIKT
jgi:hypothetical protein